MFLISSTTLVNLRKPKTSARKTRVGLHNPTLGLRKPAGCDRRSMRSALAVRFLAVHVPVTLVVIDGEHGVCAEYRAHLPCGPVVRNGVTDAAHCVISAQPHPVCGEEVFDTVSARGTTLG